MNFIILAFAVPGAVWAQETSVKTGTLHIHVQAGEVPINTSVSAYASDTGQRVWPLQDLWKNDTKNIIFPAGTYDIHVDNPGLGGEDQVLSSINLSPGSDIDRTVNFKAIGTLTINAEWTGRPLWKQKLRYYWKHWPNLGGLMGGSYTPPPGGISVRIKITKNTGEELFETLSVGKPAPLSLDMVQGQYGLRVVPGYWEFPQAATPVEIIAGQETIKSYTFPWPERD